MQLNITTHSGTPLEERGREQLVRLLRTYDVERWLYTRDVLIRSFLNPTSRPILRVNTRQIDNDDACLGTFLHEQFHWFAAGKPEQTKAAVASFRDLYPVVPDELPEGAKSEYGTYLHLAICTLEFDALCVLLGDERARKVIDERDYYTWVYRKVLDDGDSIRNVLERNGLGLP